MVAKLKTVLTSILLALLVLQGGVVGFVPTQVVYAQYEGGADLDSNMDSYGGDDDNSDVGDSDVGWGDDDFAGIDTTSIDTSSSGDSGSWTNPDTGLPMDTPPDEPSAFEKAISSLFGEDVGNMVSSALSSLETSYNNATDTLGGWIGLSGSTVRDAISSAAVSAALGMLAGPVSSLVGFDLVDYASWAMTAYDVAVEVNNALGKPMGDFSLDQLSGFFDGLASSSNWDDPFGAGMMNQIEAAVPSDGDGVRDLGSRLGIDLSGFSDAELSNLDLEGLGDVLGMDLGGIPLSELGDMLGIDMSNLGSVDELFASGGAGGGAVPAADYGSVTEDHINRLLQDENEEPYWLCAYNTNLTDYLDDLLGGVVEIVFSGIYPGNGDHGGGPDVVPVWENNSVLLKNIESMARISEIDIYKKCVLDPVAHSLKSFLVDEITADTMEWIKQGFEGGPMFLTSPILYNKDLSYAVLESYLHNEDEFEMTLEDHLCDPFAEDVIGTFAQNAVQQDFHQIARVAKYGCTIEDDTYEAVMYGTDEAPPRWSEVAQLRDGANNPVSAYFAVDTVAQKRVNTVVESKKTLLEYGDGHSSPLCEFGEDSGVYGACTPGQFVATQIDDWLGGGLGQLENASDAGAILNEAYARLVTDVFMPSEERAPAGLLSGAYRAVLDESNNPFDYEDIWREYETEPEFSHENTIAERLPDPVTPPAEEEQGLVCGYELDISLEGVSAGISCYYNGIYLFSYSYST